MVSDPLFDGFFTKAIAATSIDEVKQIFRDANEYAARQHFAVAQGVSWSVRFDLLEPAQLLFLHGSLLG
jgi:hypothetical protein